MPQTAKGALHQPIQLCRKFHPLACSQARHRAACLAQRAHAGVQEGHQLGVSRVCLVGRLAHRDVVVIVQHHKVAIPAGNRGGKRNEQRVSEQLATGPR